MAGGRPSKFKPEFVGQAEKLAALGATDRDVAEFFGISEATLHRWKHTQPEFCDALKVGKEASDQRVEQSLYRKAVGYTFDSEKVFQHQGEIVRAKTVEHVPPDTTACIFWLKNRRPDLWRDKQVVEHEGEIEVTDARERLARIVAGHATAADADGGAGKPH